MRDIFVIGINEEKIMDRLFEEDASKADVTIQTSLKLALSKESALNERTIGESFAINSNAKEIKQEGEVNFNRHRYNPKNPSNSVHKTYTKENSSWGATVRPEEQNKNYRQGNEFYGVIVGGSPGQTFNVAFDTAWSVSWVMSKQCTKVPTPGCENHNLYDHGRSSSWKKNGTPYIANEGDFNFTGFYSYDIFKIAHSNVTNYLFVEMVGVPDFMSLHKSDGIFGLGIKNDDYEPFFYAMYRQKKIRDPIFSIYLNRDRQSKRGGNVLLGFIDDKHIHKTQLKNGSVVPDEIKYLPVTSNQFWQFAVDKIVVVPDHPPHNENVTLCPNGCSAISNTGSNEIVGPPADIDQIHDLIDAQLHNGSWVVNCDTVNKLPKIDFVLGGQYFRLGGPNYIIKISSGPYTMCVSAFSSYQTDKDMWILGGAFLSQYYSIYNIEDKTIGFVRVP